MIVEYLSSSTFQVFVKRRNLISQSSSESGCSSVNSNIRSTGKWSLAVITRARLSKITQHGGYEFPLKIPNYNTTVLSPLGKHGTVENTETPVFSQRLGPQVSMQTTASVQLGGYRSFSLPSLGPIQKKIRVRHQQQLCTTTSFHYRKAQWSCTPRNHPGRQQWLSPRLTAHLFSKLRTEIKVYCLPSGSFL